MPEAIEERFRVNLDRVKGLVAHYESVAGRSRGRASVAETDLLRAAVVFLHATLEDLLRSVAQAKYPAASPDVLGQFPLIGSKDPRKNSFRFKELAAYRHDTVSGVLTRSIAASLDRTSFNNVGDIVRLLEEIGIPKSLPDAHRGRLAALMSRRHLIAHRADRNDRHGKGHHAAVSLGKSAVARWITAVEKLGTSILEHL